MNSARARERRERARARARAGARARGREKGKECITAATYDPSNSGAEWWTQVIDDEDEIGWHWDKDYALEGSGVNVHPQLGTVTYFCDNGAPTVVVNRPTNVQCDFGCGDIGVCGAVTECVVSWPEWGKQITFDGKFLHGAPAELARGSARKEKRVTFLVNVWLNHKPVTAEPLSADELSAMKATKRGPSDKLDGGFDRTSSRAGARAGRRRDVLIEIVRFQFQVCRSKENARIEASLILDKTKRRIFSGHRSVQCAATR